MAKSKVAQLKSLSVPRLELQAALIGARLGKFIQDELEYTISQRFFWLDSSTIIRWIRSESRTRQIYVANRLGEISDLTKSSEWLWIPTADNPADDATRYSNNAMQENLRWFKGPSFLKLPQVEWLKDKILSKEEKGTIDNLETRKVKIFLVTQSEKEFSLHICLLGWQGLLIIARRVQRAFYKWKRFAKVEKSVGSIEMWENYNYRKIQTDRFKNEIKALRKGKEISKGSKLAGVRPYLDEKGILRAKGQMPFFTGLKFNNNPIILESKHPTTIELIKHYHRKFYRASSNAILNEMRQKYCIVGLRSTSRSIISKCTMCRLLRGKPRNPLMGDLPEAQLAARRRPFTHCGVDFFGPMLVKVDRRREKRWGVIFTCLSTRAIHIELASSLSTSSAIMAIQRLATRRGVPTDMYSDNGTNFRGASKELKEAILKLDKEKIVEFSLNRQIEWHFNPPDAPHMGGAWERMVRSVKAALKAVLFYQAPSEEVLITTLCEIEHSVNSRPLTHVSLDPLDGEALTPNHFLIGASSGEVRLGRYDEKILCTRKHYRIAQYYADCFWKRWIREYLPELLSRTKWVEKVPPLEFGDVVLIADLSSPRNTWKKGVQGVLQVNESLQDRTQDLIMFLATRRYPPGPPPPRYNSPHREPHKRFDDVAPPGTEGYYDLPPPGVDHPERPADRSHLPREPGSKNQEPEDRDRGPPREDRARDREDRNRERDDRRGERDDRERPAPLMKERDDRIREKDDRDRRDKDRDDKHSRRDDERQFEKRDYEKDRFREERERHRVDDKGRPRDRDRDRDRRDRDYDGDKDRDRHDRYEKVSTDRKKKRSPSPYVSKSRTEMKDVSPERPRKKDRDHDDKPEEKKKEKKIKDKKKKKDSEEKEKKKKKKKEKKLIQKEALKEEQAKATETEVKAVEEKAEEASALLKVENIKPEEPQETLLSSETSIAPTEEFEEKSLAINPEPPETEQSPPKVEDPEPGANPPNPNFKPIPELKTEVKTEIKAMDSLYSGLDDTEINTVITEKYAILPEGETEEKEQPVESKSPKKDEFLAPIPELSKWERDDTIERPEGAPESEDKEESEESKDNKVVTSEVLKRAENAIFQKAINAIRPIEIKKISESRKVLYQNPEPKVLEVEPPREQRKSVNVTINVGKNERNVEISEPAKKAKLDRSKFKPVPESHSPTRLSAKERLGEKVEDEKERNTSPKGLMERRDVKTEPRPRSRSPRIIRERRVSPVVEKRLEPVPVNPERKVFLEERKRDRTDRPKEKNDSRSRQEPRIEREPRIDPRPDLRADLRAAKIERERERDRTPPIVFRKIEIPKVGRKEEEVEREKEKKKEKKREEKKRKKEHRSRSKSKDRKKKKEKKHKKDKEKHQEKKQKHKEKIASAEKVDGIEEKLGTENLEASSAAEATKKQRKNPRLVSDRKRSMLDEASFEPDYSASESESEGEVKVVPVKKVKLEEIQAEREVETKSKKRLKSLSSDDESSSTESTSSESESSDESHRKRKKKHKKHKKRKSSRKETSSDTDSYTDSTDSSSEEERHRKRSKKSKKSKQKKKKKSKHK